MPGSTPVVGFEPGSPARLPRLSDLSGDSPGGPSLVLPDAAGGILLVRSSNGGVGAPYSPGGGGGANLTGRRPSDAGGGVRIVGSRRGSEAGGTTAGGSRLRRASQVSEPGGSVLAVALHSFNTISPGASRQASELPNPDGVALSPHEFHAKLQQLRQQYRHAYPTSPPLAEDAYQPAARATAPPKPTAQAAQEAQQQGSAGSGQNTAHQRAKEQVQQQSGDRGQAQQPAPRDGSGPGPQCGVNHGQGRGQGATSEQQQGRGQGRGQGATALYSAAPSDDEASIPTLDTRPASVVDAYGADAPGTRTSAQTEGGRGGNSGSGGGGGASGGSGGTAGAGKYGSLQLQVPAPADEPGPDAGAGHGVQAGDKREGAAAGAGVEDAPPLPLLSPLLPQPPFRLEPIAGRTSSGGGVTDPGAGVGTAGQQRSAATGAAGDGAGGGDGFDIKGTGDRSQDSRGGKALGPGGGRSRAGRDVGGSSRSAVRGRRHRRTTFAGLGDTTSDEEGERGGESSATAVTAVGHADAQGGFLSPRDGLLAPQRTPSSTSKRGGGRRRGTAGGVSATGEYDEDGEVYGGRGLVRSVSTTSKASHVSRGGALGAGRGGGAGLARAGGEDGTVAALSKSAAVVASGNGGRKVGGVCEGAAAWKAMRGSLDGPRSSCRGPFTPENICLA